MSLALTPVGPIRAAEEPDFAFLSDIAVTGDLLVTGSASSNGLGLWRIGPGGALQKIAARPADPGSGTAGIGDLWAGRIGGWTGVVPAGRYDDALVLHGLAPAGFAPSLAAWTGAAAGGYTAVLGLEAGGEGWILGARRGAEGLWLAPAAGGVAPVLAASSAGDLALDGVTALASAAIGGRDFVLAASGHGDGVALFEMAAGGVLTLRDSLSKAGGLPIDAPAALAVAETAGGTFAVVAGSGTSSLTVLRIDPDAGLSVADHLLDTRETRFGAVSALAGFEIGGRDFVAAAGGDGGLTLFELSADGRLGVAAVLVDDAATALQGIGALAAAPDGDGAVLFVAGQGEGALDRYRVALAPADPALPEPDRVPLPAAITAPRELGFAPPAAPAQPAPVAPPVPVVITGTEGPDDLRGAAGPDVIRDGGGRDRLTGGAGADVFVFCYDRIPDAVTDFDPAEDRVDLSAWRGARGIGDLRITPTDWGAEVAFFEDAAYLASAAGGPLTAAALADAFLFG